MLSERAAPRTPRAATVLAAHTVAGSGVMGGPMAGHLAGVRPVTHEVVLLGWSIVVGTPECKPPNVTVVMHDGGVMAVAENIHTARCEGDMGEETQQRGQEHQQWGMGIILS